MKYSNLHLSLRCGGFTRIGYLLVVIMWMVGTAATANGDLVAISSKEASGNALVWAKNTGVNGISTMQATTGLLTLGHVHYQDPKPDDAARSTFHL